MSRKIIPSVVLAALAGFSTLALADPPAVVGRISAVQGQVTLVGGDDGNDEPVAALLNWPVTGANHINTASGARTEFRVGSTAVRVDGASDLEITDMGAALRASSASTPGPTSATGSRRRWCRPATCPPASPATRSWTATAAGPRASNTARCGRRAMSPSTGRHTATAAGPGWRRGAGPGST